MKQFMSFIKTTTLVYGATNAAPTVAYGATSPEALAGGAIALYSKSGTTGKLQIIDAAADFLDVKNFVVARGNISSTTATAADGATFSDLIDRKTLTVEKYTAVAAVAQVSTLAFPATLPAGTIVVVQVIDTSSNIHSEWRSINYEYTTLAANESSATISAALLTKINANAASIVTASGALVLTADVAGKKFAVNVQDGLTGELLAGATVTATTAPVKAEGYLAGVQALELECAGYEGKTRRGDIQVGDLYSGSTIDTTATSYVMYMLTWQTPIVRRAAATDATVGSFRKLYLAIPTGSGLIAGLDPILVMAAQEEIAAQVDETGV